MADDQNINKSPEHSEPEALYDHFNARIAAIDKAFAENQKALDQGLLTISSAAIFALLVFVQDLEFVPSEKMFFAGVAPFVFSILFTLASYLVASPLLKEKQIQAHEYFIKRNEEAFVREFRWGPWLARAHWSSAISFILGTILASCFVYSTLNEKKENLLKRYPPLPTTQKTNDSPKPTGGKNTRIDNAVDGGSMTMVKPSTPPPKSTPTPTVPGNSNQGPDKK